MPMPQFCLLRYIYAPMLIKKAKFYFENDDYFYI